MKELFLLRGLPGAGKSTLADSLGGNWIEANQYFINKEGVYQFDVTKLKDAHHYCQARVEHVMEFYSNGEETIKYTSFGRIIVSNTFTQEWEMQPYYDLAEKYGYRVYSLIVENRHDGINQHGVPVEKLIEMKNRFQVKL
jgi:predicted kinase